MLKTSSRRLGDQQMFAGPADIITRHNFKNLAKEDVWWHGPSFLINNTKLNEKVMQPGIL